MEFRSCPSCKASVLEDDAEDCPFCGASMSGKPSAKPASKPAPGPAARPSQRATPPATGRPAAPTAPGQRGAPTAKSPTASGPVRARPEPEDDRPTDNSDPFEVDPLVHKQATSIAIKPGKGRTTEVKCPMCETVGYIGPSQAGKDVKCCNPSCKLPIFKAPKLPPVVQKEPEKPKGMSKVVLSAIAMVALSAFGGALYWFVLREDPKPKTPVTNTPVEVDKEPEKELLPNEVVIPTKHVVSTNEEIGQLSLQEILKVTIKPEFRSKPYGRQLAAQALLTTGDLAGAQEQISKLGVGSEQYAIEPLALLAQLKLDAGDKAGAEAALQEAVNKSAKHPDVLRSHLDAVVVLAATLVRSGQTADAVKLLERFDKSDVDARATLSEIWRASLDQGTFHFADEFSLSHLELCGRPLWVTVSIELCRQQQWDQAIAWSRSAPDVVTRDASLAAFAGMVTTQLNAKADGGLADKLKEAIVSADLAAKVRMQVASAEVRFLFDKKSVTSTQVTEIEQLLASTQTPSALMIPGMKEIYESKGTPFAGLPDPGPGTSLALAFADIANLKMKLGDTAGGWSTQTQAMEMLRSVGPSPALARSLVERSTKGADVSRQLGQTLGLGDDETKKRRALSQYRGQCEEILKLANSRFAIQQTLLRRSMRFGALEDVWAFIREFDQAEESRREPYRSELALIVDLYYTALSQGKDDFLKQNGGEFTPQERQAIKAAYETFGTLARSITSAQAGQLREAAETLKTLYVKSLVNRNLLDRHVLTQASLLSEKSITDSYQYIQKLFDPTIREDAMRLLAGFSIRVGKGPELWKLLEEDRDLPATDRATTCLGFLEGIQSLDK